jgi:hypothetical protein
MTRPSRRALAAFRIPVNESAAVPRPDPASEEAYVSAKNEPAPDWTAMVDEALARMEGMTGREAGGRSGISPECVYDWRVRRRKGRTIHEVRGANREALLRFLESDYQTGSIPIPARARIRRSPGPRARPTAPAPGGPGRMVPGRDRGT